MYVSWNTKANNMSEQRMADKVKENKEESSDDEEETK
jgi:hypothetical protein